MSRLSTLLRTAWALGFVSIVRVVAYRIALSLRVHPVQRLRGVAPAGPFFRPLAEGLPPIVAPSVTNWKNSARLFGRWSITIDASPPDWRTDPLSGVRGPDLDRPWWSIPDFDPQVGDIKRIWELSRMDWLLAMAQRARQGDCQELSRLNNWLADWCRNSIPYLGPNWKCGQEASIRVMHLAMTALILDQAKQPEPGLLELVRLHMRRIAPTLSYAVGQNNNHGTSEAAALFIGGTWLQAQGVRGGEYWAATGRRVLEERVATLVAGDGSFSQYSLNYHRVLLDTCSMAEIWRRHMDLPLFSSKMQTCLRAAVRWLQQVIDPESGDGPNLGANDGARLLPLADTAYRDYRPSLQLAMVLFAGQRACAHSGAWDYPLQWLNVPLPEKVAPLPGSVLADEGGYAVMRHGVGMALLRYPRFRFRPSQADVLHLDFWYAGVNYLRDAGSYSYNTEAQWLHYFGGTGGHNTVQFDDRDQMPRLGRFLFGDWLQTRQFEPLEERDGGLHVAAGYRDRLGARHLRRVGLHADCLSVHDEVGGFTRKAVLRWRLAPGAWRLDGCGATDGMNQVVVHADMQIVRCELIEGWESRHYLEKTSLPVLEVEVHESGTLSTYFRVAK